MLVSYAGYLQVKGLKDSPDSFDKFFRAATSIPVDCPIYCQERDANYGCLRFSNGYRAELDDIDDFDERF